MDRPWDKCDICGVKPYFQRLEFFNFRDWLVYLCSDCLKWARRTLGILRGIVERHVEDTKR